MVERSLPTPEICGSNPNIGKFYLPIVHLNRKVKNKEREAGMAHLLRKICVVYRFYLIKRYLYSQQST